MRYLLIILLGIFTYSCTEEDNQDGMVIGNVSFTLSPTTRANELIEFVEGDAVGVYVLDRTNNSTLKSAGNYADNKKYVWNSDKKAFIAADNDNLIFNSPDRQLDFYVYFPYKSQVVDATSMPHVITGNSKTDDFLFAINDEHTGKKDIPLNFHHLLSKANVMYTSSENREHTAMTIHTYTDTKVDLSAGVVNTTANRRTDLPLEKVSGDTHISFIGIVPPQTWAPGEQFCMLSYTDLGTAYPFSFAEERVFVSGETNDVKFMPKELTYKFIASPASLNYAALDGTRNTFVVTSEKSEAINGVILPGTTVSQPYSLSSKPDWVVISGNEITVTENRTTSSRAGAVVFLQNESNLTTTITIGQSAGTISENYIFTFSDGSASKAWSGVSATGGTNSYTITSLKETYVNGVKDATENISYSGSSNVSWVTVSGNNLSVAENRTTSSRNGTVTFTQATSGKQVTVLVEQSAGTISENYIFTFSDGSASKAWSGVSATGGANSYTITSLKETYVNGAKDATENISYSGSSNVNWVTVSGNNLSVAENRTTSSRNGTVTFTQATSGKQITVLVEQSAGVITTDYTFTFSDGSTSKSWTSISASGASNSYTITSYKRVYVNGTLDRTEYPGYSSSANVNWASASGGTISVSENNSTAPRGGVMTFTQSESGKTVQVTLSQLKKSSVDIN